MSKGKPQISSLAGRHLLSIQMPTGWFGNKKEIKEVEEDLLLTFSNQ